MTEQERDQILLKLLEIVSGHDEKFSSIQEIFSGCNQLRFLPDISKWKTDNVTKLNDLFNNLFFRG